MRRSLTRAGLRLERWFATRSASRRWAPTIAWYAVIFALSQAPGTDVDATERYLSWVALGDLNTWFRISAHATVFGLLGVFVYGALARGFRFDGARYVQAVAITTVLGLLDELHQYLVPLRRFRLEDAALDALGGALGIAAAIALFGRLRHADDRATRGSPDVIR